MLGRTTAKLVWSMAKRWKRFPFRRSMLDWVQRNGHVDLAGGTVRVQTDAGPVMEVDPADAHGWLLLRDRAIKPCFARVFRALLRRGDSVIDVGANHGYFTLLAASLVTHAGHVYAFEPDPPVARLLLENVRINGLTNVKLHQAAASNAPGTTEYRMNAPTAPARRGGGAPVPTLVPVVTIDSLKDEMPRVRLVKIDVNGSEVLVLEGMKELLRYDRPFVILDVVDERIRKVHGSAGEIFTILHGLGYATHTVGPDGARPIDRPGREPSFCLLGAPPGSHLPDMSAVKA